MASVAKAFAQPVDADDVHTPRSRKPATGIASLLTGYMQVGVGNGANDETVEMAEIQTLSPGATNPADARRALYAKRRAAKGGKAANKGGGFYSSLLRPASIKRSILRSPSGRGGSPETSPAGGAKKGWAIIRRAAAAQSIARALGAPSVDRPRPPPIVVPATRRASAPLEDVPKISPPPGQTPRKQRIGRASLPFAMVLAEPEGDKEEVSEYDKDTETGTDLTFENERAEDALSPKSAHRETRRRRMLEEQLKRHGRMITKNAAGRGFELAQGHSDAMKALLASADHADIIAHAEWQKKAARQLNRVSRQYWAQHVFFFWSVVVSVTVTVVFRVALLNRGDPELLPFLPPCPA